LVCRRPLSEPNGDKPQNHAIANALVVSARKFGAKGSFFICLLAFDSSDSVDAVQLCRRERLLLWPSNDYAVLPAKAGSANERPASTSAWLGGVVYESPFPFAGLLASAPMMLPIPQTTKR